MPIENWNGSGVIKDAGDKLFAILQKIGLDGEREIKQSMGQEPSPAPPGHPPAVVTGRARASVTQEADRSELRLSVGSPVLYLLFLELGTSKMQPRPWLIPWLLRLQKNMKQYFK